MPQFSMRMSDRYVTRSATCDEPHKRWNFGPSDDSILWEKFNVFLILVKPQTHVFRIQVTGPCGLG